MNANGRHSATLSRIANPTVGSFVSSIARVGEPNETGDETKKEPVVVRSFGLDATREREEG